MKKILSFVAVMALALGISGSAKAQYGSCSYRAPCLDRPIHAPVYPGAHHAPIHPVSHAQPYYPQPSCHGHLPVRPVHPGFGQLPGINPVDINININTIIGDNNVLNNLNLRR